MSSRAFNVCFALCVVLAIGGLIYFLEDGRRRLATPPRVTTPVFRPEPSEAIPPEGSGLERRAAPVRGIHVPRPEPRDATGMLVREGRDALGREATTPDVVGLLGWLDAGRYAELDSALARMSDGALARPECEHWGRLGFGAFVTDDPTTEARLDAWVAATESWQAHLARAMHLVTLGYERRGHETIDRTSPAQIEAMYEAFGRAMEELAIVRARRPNEVVAHATMISILQASGDVSRARSVFEEAAAHCAHCLGPRMDFAQLLLPRWGGSIAEFEAFTRGEAARRGAPRSFAVLRGMPAWRECYQREHQERYDEALPFCDAAVEVVPYEMFLRLRARLHRRADRRDLEARDVRAILEMTPFSLEGHYAAFDLAAHERDYVRAAEHFRMVAWMSPVDERLRRNLSVVVDGLRWQAERAAVEGDADVVTRAHELGLQLAPSAFGGRDRALELIEAQGAVNEAPLDFEAVLELDRQLAPRRRWAEIVAAWDHFLEANPDHAEALLERSGTYFHWGRLDEAERDARRACELGSSEACVRADQVAGRRGR